MGPNKKCWNTWHLRRNFTHEWRNKWLSKRPYWLKGKYPKRFWHIKYHDGRWYLLRGTKVMARSHSKYKGFVGGYFDFKEFLRYCKAFKRIVTRRKKYLIKRNKSFEEQMQFFTAYNFAKETPKNEQNTDYDLIAFERLMRGIERDRTKSWRELDDGDEGQDDGLSRWADED